MRIVGGIYRGRKLSTPTDNTVRPTADRVREAIFNILAHNVPPLPGGATVLDLFCGTGAFGLEALSRGARHVTFVDQAPSSLRLTRENASTLGVQGDCTFVNADATRLKQSAAVVDLVFADPPYGKDLVGPALVEAVKSGWIDNHTIIFVEVPSVEGVDISPQFLIDRDWTYGQTKITKISLAT